MKGLWIGDAVTQTGFGRVTHNIVGPLKQNHGWEMQVLGVNYNGDPHTYDYPIWPAIPGGDIYGLGRVGHLCAQFKPDVIVINNDPWVVAEYVQAIPKGIPVVAYMPVDAPNQRSASKLQLARAVAYTNFGRKELIVGGYNGQVDVIPHGVDTETYKPVDKVTARGHIKFKTEVDPKDLFIVGNVNRNQPRKRLDLTIQYWTQWWINAGQPKEAFLYLHCSNMDEGYDVIQLAKYYGIEKQFVITSRSMTVHNCMFEKDLHMVYNIADVNMSTTLGEGWGLTTHESAACRVAQALPRYSALGEVWREAAHFVDVTSFSVTPTRINTIGGVADRDQMVAAIQKFFEDKDYRKQMADLAYARATEPRFQWKAVAEQFHMVLTETVLERRSGPVGVEAPK